jgi:hypothetical protein
LLSATQVEDNYDMRTGLRLMHDMAVDAVQAMKVPCDKCVYHSHGKSYRLTRICRYKADDLAGKRAIVPTSRMLFMPRSGHSGFDVLMDLVSISRR